MSQFAIIVAGAAVAAVALIFLLFKLMWRVAEPNEALVISGLRADRPSDQVGESLGFKIVTGKGTLVIPGVQQVRRLSLDLREAELGLDCVTHQGIPLSLRGVVMREARIAQAHADREATENEQQAEALKAAARRESMIKQASYQAEVDTATAKAKQAGPLADAAAHQEVVVQEAKVAELEAQREEMRLQATVRKPADAQAYQQVTLSKADRDARIAHAEAERQVVELNAAATSQKIKLEAAAEAEHVRLQAESESGAIRMRGDAEASATQAKGLAEGEAVRA